MTSKEAFEKMVELCNFYHHTIVKDTDIQLICGYPIDNIRRDLEALEIIKEKGVNVGLLSRCSNAERYNNGMCYESRYLTQEEYDLLKEELC